MPWIEPTSSVASFCGGYAVTVTAVGGYGVAMVFCGGYSAV